MPPLLEQRGWSGSGRWTYRVIRIRRGRRHEDDILLPSTPGMLRLHRPLQIHQVHRPGDGREGIFGFDLGGEEVHVGRKPMEGSLNTRPSPKPGKEK